MLPEEAVQVTADKLAHLVVQVLVDVVQLKVLMRQQLTEQPVQVVVVVVVAKAVQEVQALLLFVTTHQLL
jgi:hypothetical protein